MKKLAIFLFALVTAFAASAASLSFVKVGGTYKLDYIGADVVVTVLADQGDGWYHCSFVKDGSVSFVNFNQAIWVTVEREPVAAARLPSLFESQRTPEQVRKAISNNLRQLSGAADQYYLESGASQAQLSDLVGPTKYVRQLNSVDGEDYSALVFKIGVPLKVITRTGMVVSYGP